MTTRAELIKRSQVSKLEAEFAMQVRALRLPQPKREYEFHPVRKWRFDFAWPELLIAVECEGGTRSNGRHVRGDGFENDCEKYAEAALSGWLVLRVTWDQIESMKATVWLQRALLLRRTDGLTLDSLVADLLEAWRSDVDSVDPYLERIHRWVETVRVGVTDGSVPVQNPRSVREEKP